MNQDKQIDISVIVTSHNEGLIAHKTMLSVFAAIKEIEKAGYSYEIIVSIDNGDDQTLSYFNRYKHEKHIKLLNVDFKDLSSSRNNASKAAQGSYLSFIDADDLMSSNWLLAGIESAKLNPGSIVHPEYSITFGDDNLIWQKRNSSNPTNDILTLIDNNLWDSPCFAEKKVFLKHPYYPNGNGFGYEDKHFNAQTLADNIKHIVAPKTLLFVRRKISGSMLRQSSENLATIAPTDLFAFEKLKNLDIRDFSLSTGETNNFSSVKNKLSKVAKKGLLSAHSLGKRSDTYLKLIQPLRELRQGRVAKKLNDTYPKWMLDSWKDIHIIDNSTFPAKALLKSLGWYNSENKLPGYKYVQFVQDFSNKPDTLFFVPHLIKGGADKLFINYVSQLHKSHTNWNIGVIQTEQKDSVWKEKLPSDVDFIDLYTRMNGVDTDTQHRLLATFITQNDIKRIIIGNSQLAYDFVSKYQSLIIRLRVSIYCFAFGEEFDDEGRLWGHIHTGIPRIYPVVTRIITDNNNTVNKLEAEYAFEKEKFRVHYQPTDIHIGEPVKNDHAQLRILWASRVCKQKRPDILKAVSNNLNVKDFIVDAYGELEEGLTEQYFDDSKVNYKGSFNGISSIPTGNYDVYLYTSEGDGIPNVLQEITASGLPIVASNVGGIREFVQTDKTGLLIEDHEVIADYVSAITKLRDKKIRITLNTGAQTLLRKNFSHESWETKVLKDIR